MAGSSVLEVGQPGPGEHVSPDGPKAIPRVSEWNQPMNELFHLWGVPVEKMAVFFSLGLFKSCSLGPGSSPGGLLRGGVVGPSGSVY